MTLRVRVIVPLPLGQTALHAVKDCQSVTWLHGRELAGTARPAVEQSVSATVVLVPTVWQMRAVRLIVPLQVAEQAPYVGTY